MPPSPERRALPATLRIALITDKMDWHARKLVVAFAALGIEAVPVDLVTCAFDTARPHGIAMAGFGDALPDGVFVRTLSGGSFEAVTLRLGLLHALRELGVPVWNDARAVERCVDKSTTSFLIARAGIATPATFAVQSRDAAAAVVRAEAGPLVLKPLFGSQGRGLRLIHCVDDLPEPAAVSGVYYLQRYVAIECDGFRDFRLLVSRGRIVAAMVRHAPTWITNVKRGGRPVIAVAEPEAKELAIRAAVAVGADFAGVDLLYGADGRPTVLEVNSMPAWSGLQQVATVDIASTVAADFAEVLRRRAREAV